MEQEDFKKHLKEYYSYLLFRLDKGSSYLEKNSNNVKAQELYQEIVEELAEIEKLMNFYKIDKEC